MQNYFPGLKYCRGKDGPTWRGVLKPREKSPEYTVKMVYKEKTIPKVWIVSPKIDYAPHRYFDQSLCLYYPDDRSWTSDLFLAETIVPWTAEWLAFYEIWYVTGIWYGDEVPHNGKKK